MVLELANGITKDDEVIVKPGEYIGSTKCSDTVPVYIASHSRAGEDAGFWIAATGKIPLPTHIFQYYAVDHEGVV